MKGKDLSYLSLVAATVLGFVLLCFHLAKPYMDKLAIVLGQSTNMPGTQQDRRASRGPYRSVVAVADRSVPWYRPTQLARGSPPSLGLW